MITFKMMTPETQVLTSEGITIARNGSHEFLFWSALSSSTPMKVMEVEAVLGKDVTKIGQGKAMKNKWIKKEGDGFVRAIELVIDTTQIELTEVETTGGHSDDKVLSELRKRKLIEKKYVRRLSIFF
jgi:phenylalanyl-tRNA synthetase alpha chain